MPRPRPVSKKLEAKEAGVGMWTHTHGEGNSKKQAPKLAGSGSEQTGEFK